jgi:excisionase family DNA binding protein
MTHDDADRARPRTISPHEFATEIGISVRSVYRSIRTGDIRAVRIGHLLRIPRTEIDRLTFAASAAE